jgi:tetratricopeptide (TPR) repeat protein
MWKCAIAVLCFFGVVALGQNVDRPTLIPVERTKVAPEADLMAKYDNEVKASPRSSITHFRIAEIYFQRHNYQLAANEFREALNGDLQPRWIEVWAHVNLGKIFDITGQRDRGINEYHLAQRTKDNTRGALDEAETYLEFPYPQD